MRLVNLSWMAPFLMIATAPPGIATTAICELPPGPPGEVRCMPDDMALCEANGRVIRGQCLDRPQDLRAAQAVILSAIIGKPATDEDLERWSPAFAAGRIGRAESVFTFDIGTGFRNQDDEKGGSQSSLSTGGFGLAQGIGVFAALTGFILLFIESRRRMRLERLYQEAKRQAEAEEHARESRRARASVGYQAPAAEASASEMEARF